MSKNQLDKTETVKLIEIRIKAKKGCDSLIGKAPGEFISLIFRPDLTINGATPTKVGDVMVTELKFESFVPTNNSGTMGIAEIKVGTIHDKSKKASIMSFPMPVRMEAGKVKDCSYGNIRDFQELVDELCSEAYGLVSKDLTCIQIVAKFQQLATESICQDLFGSPNPAMAGGRCDLAQVHVGKRCPGTQLLVGFKPNGEVKCDP